MDAMWWRDTPFPKRNKSNSNNVAPMSMLRRSSIDTNTPPSAWTPATVSADADTKSLFQFKADGGLVGPLAAPGFQAYQQCSAQIKDVLLPQLASEWSDLTDTFIRARWSGGSDIFYVLTDTQDGSFIGTVAVDRSNFYPYISNLYVTPARRRAKFGKALLDHGIAFTKSMGFPDARLWCKPELVSWYESMGWKQNGKHEVVGGIKVVLMICAV